MSIMNILKVDCDPKKIGLNRFSVTDNFLRILALQEITNFIFYSFYSTLLKKIDLLKFCLSSFFMKKGKNLNVYEKPV